MDPRYLPRFYSHVFFSSSNFHHNSLAFWTTCRGIKDSSRAPPPPSQLNGYLSPMDVYRPLASVLPPSRPNPNPNPITLTLSSPNFIGLCILSHALALSAPFSATEKDHKEDMRGGGGVMAHEMQHRLKQYMSYRGYCLRSSDSGNYCIIAVSRCFRCNSAPQKRSHCDNDIEHHPMFCRRDKELARYNLLQGMVD